MAKGYIELPLSGRLLGQQIEYATESSEVTVPSILQGNPNTITINEIDVTGLTEESGGYVTTLSATINITAPTVPTIEDDERLDYGDQKFTLYDSQGTRLFSIPDTPKVEIVLQEYANSWAEQGSSYRIEWITTDTSTNTYTNEFEFSILNPDDLPQVTLKYAPFVARIENVTGDTLTLNIDWDTFKEQLTYNEDNDHNALPSQKFNNWSISYKINDKRDLYTYLHLGDDKLSLITNIKSDYETFPELPHSTVLKLYEPLPEDFEEKDNVYVVREMMQQKTEVVELVPYDQEDEDVLILKIPDSANVDSPVSKRSTELQSYDDLLTTDEKLKKKIIDKYVSGSDAPVDLNIDYSNYENFINFSSAEKRLKNFKYKIQQIEGYTADSSSLVGVTSADTDLVSFDNKIRNLKNDFDGYEKYLYHTSSSYSSGSMGVFYDSSWPKTGSGSYAQPYEPVSSSHSDFTNWYGSLDTKVGQLHSASLYDSDNPNRLVNLLPDHIKSDSNNGQFLDFIDMIGQQFDELWVYTKALADITDRQNDISDGFSKDLIFNLAKSLGWDMQDGKDLLELSRFGFGQKVSGSGEYSLYTSGSASSPAEGDISKEIAKRLISSMPYLLKSKGTVGSLKGIMNCYGIPSSILRVREYGGLQKDNHRAQFEIARKFTKALGFRGSQYIISTWVDDGTTSRKPETVELRFRAVSSSNQVLVQKDTDWAIKLKDNGSSDNYGTVSFMLSGSDGYKEISSSLFPVYGGDYHSIMLRKNKINTNLFTYPSFETGSLFNPPFISDSNSAERGALEIVSSSNVAKVGSNSLRHTNTSTDGTSYSYFYRNPGNTYSTSTSSLASVSQNETYIFSAYAQASASTVDSLASLTLFELDSNENVVNWTEEFEYSTNDGGIKSSQRIGLNETEWKQIQVKKTIKFPNTSKLGIRFENNKPNSTIHWDDVSLRKIDTNSDSIADAFTYDLFVKRYDAGLDRIIDSSKTTLTITGSHAVTQSYNAAWTGSGDLYIGGNSTSPFDAGKLSGSLMEFRLWNSPLNEEYFDTHVENPKSYVGNTPSASYYNLIRRYSFDDNTTLATNASIRDIVPSQNPTQTGSAQGWAGVNAFESVVDKTKTLIPNHGPNRRMATKIRVENNFLSGSGAQLSISERFDQSANDFSPIDSPKIGIYFSPTDVVNEDIVSSFANLDFNQYLGDPRDNLKHEYRGLKDVSNQYFQKYTGNNDFWDYMHIIKYYDQSVFKNLKKLIPARSKAHMGTLIEGNIFERPKSPVQKNPPSFTTPFYTDTINISTLEMEHEDSRSVVIVETEYPTYSGRLTESFFREPALYSLGSGSWGDGSDDNWDDRNLYISGSAKIGGPNYVFSEPTGAMVLNHRKSETYKEYKFFYTSSTDFDRSSKVSTNPFVNYYTSKSEHPSEIDPNYKNSTALDRMIYSGVKNTVKTTLDGDLPVIIRTSAPTVAVPTDVGISKLRIDEKKN